MAHGALNQEKVFIPQLPEQEIISRFKNIKPVKKYSDGLYYINGFHVYNKEFLWHPNKGGVVRGLEVSVIIKTYHRIPDEGHLNFKPSIAEVLSQIPEEYLKIVRAFRVIPDSYMLKGLILKDRKQEAMNNNHHLADTELYIPS